MTAVFRLRPSCIPLYLDFCLAFGHGRDMTARPIFIHGHGNTACVTALALAHAGQPVHMALPDKGPDKAPDKAPETGPKTGPQAPTPPLWQSVLALSPAAKTMLESLAVWPKLTAATSMVCDMAVYGSAADWADGRGLSFAAPPENQAPLLPLAHIVSLADLTAALRAAVHAAIARGEIQALPAPIVDFDPADGTVFLRDGTRRQAALMIDGQRHPAAWRQDAPRLAYDYDMAALVGAVKTTQPHGQTAVQLFLPPGPLALLPLAEPNRRAMIWSMPKERAEALQAAPKDMFEAELTRACGTPVGRISADGPLAVQELALRLADIYVDRHLCLLGDAAHSVHPLAGQGFNLSLRDAALLADCLYEAGGLGLAADGPHVLAAFIRQRRGDAGLTAAVTHGLVQMFCGPTSSLTGPLGRLGLRLTGELAERLPAVKKTFTRQADGAARGLPRLMRGATFS